MSITKKNLLTLLTLLVSANTLAAEKCGDVYAGGGTVTDYNEAKAKGNLGSVERRHFTRNVQNLIKGESTSELMADLAYTLRKFPNHYPALQSLIKYDLKLNGKLPQVNASYTQSVNCFFARAFQFKPNDRKLRQLYGFYFHINNQYKQAIEQYILAKADRENVELDYNIGLAYFKLGDLERAKQYAQKAYANNFPLSGLRDMLSSKGIALTTNAKAKD